MSNLLIKTKVEDGITYYDTPLNEKKYERLWDFMYRLSIPFPPYPQEINVKTAELIYTQFCNNYPPQDDINWFKGFDPEDIKSLIMSFGEMDCSVHATRTLQCEEYSTQTRFPEDLDINNPEELSPYLDKLDEGDFDWDTSDEYTNLFTKDLQCEFLGKLPYKDIRSQNPSRYVVTCEVGTYNCKEVA